MIDVPLSVLEIPAFAANDPVVDAVGIVEVAQTIERLRYKRIWYAEHHKSLGFAAFPPAVSIARAAAATSAIRVGSGGVLAVNHAPLSLAEQFGALSTYFPGRIDLGIGRGPGTFDETAARALRRGADPATEDEYKGNVAEILARARHVTEKVDQPLPDVASAALHEFTDEEWAEISKLRAHAALGSPEVVQARLTELAVRFGADEVMLGTPVVDAKARARSFELIMEGY
jgi:alkanesulfonate monooxygenase SsuD/methylene tetrahydromethanopterin reductase-like flavin-dependent oxidoreductase (luciferase family)